MDPPLHGLEGQGWFLGVRCFTNYVKVGFFRGASLRPIAPAASRSKDTRTLDIDEDDQLDKMRCMSGYRQRFSRALL
jgi:hypothetical protein